MHPTLGWDVELGVSQRAVLPAHAADPTPSSTSPLDAMFFLLNSDPVNTANDLVRVHILPANHRDPICADVIQICGYAYHF